MPTVSVEGKKYRYTVKHYPGGYIAVCKEMPDIDVYGKTLVEIEKEMTKAITGYLHVFKDRKIPVVP
jgi:predicted RNase H-like HicB family nuclease